MAKSIMREKLERNEAVLCGGCWDTASALIQDRLGFDAVKLGSSQLAGSYGLPDIGLLTASQVRDAVYSITDRIDIPLMVDFESGFGSEDDIASAVYWAKEFERAGASSIHIDDYGDDKCPFLPPYIPKLMSAESVADKIKAICDHRASRDFLIMVRSGATSSVSFTDKEKAFDESLRRFRMWKEAGADIVWGRAYSEDHLDRLKTEIGGFLSQSIGTKTGQGKVGAGGREEKIYTVREWSERGYNLLTVGASFFSISYKAIHSAAKILRETGDSGQIDQYCMPFMDWMGTMGFDEYMAINKIEGYGKK